MTRAETCEALQLLALVKQIDGDPPGGLLSASHSFSHSSATFLATVLNLPHSHAFTMLEGITGGDGNRFTLSITINRQPSYPP